MQSRNSTEGVSRPGSELDQTVEERINGIVELSRRMLGEVATVAQRIADINRATHVLSMNARVEAARAGTAGAGFGVVAEELTRLSRDISSATETIVANSRARGVELDKVIEHLFTHVHDSRYCDLAYTNVDLVDRNLYERSCDVRWWATDAAVWRCLADNDEESRRHASQRMGQILDSYTVYYDLVVADLDGVVVTNGRPSKFRSRGQRVGDSQWFRSALAARDGTEYGFESVHRSSLVGDRRSLVYSCAVREGGGVHGRVLGVLGIVFDWEALGDQVVRRTPLSSDEWATTRACLVDENGLVLADSAPISGTRSTVLDFPERQKLFSGQRGIVATLLDSQPVRIAHAASPGFETYRTGWHSLLIRQMKR
ncbi:MAG: cache domain-containing protein [Steroidobacteraceae bacterium]